jgi:hypothetical protein
MARMLRIPGIRQDQKKGPSGAVSGAAEIVAQIQPFSHGDTEARRKDQKSGLVVGYSSVSPCLREIFGCWLFIRSILPQNGPLTLGRGVAKTLRPLVAGVMWAGDTP